MNKSHFSFSESNCESSWFAVEGICFRIYAGNMTRNWFHARTYCLDRGGDLAVVDSELKRQVIASRLDNNNSIYPNLAVYRVSIGVRLLVKWHWLGGRIISSHYWRRGQPDPLTFLDCAVLQRWSSVGWKLVQAHCYLEREFLCQTRESKNFELISGFDKIAKWLSTIAQNHPIITTKRSLL